MSQTRYLVFAMLSLNIVFASESLWSKPLEIPESERPVLIDERLFAVFCLLSAGPFGDEQDAVAGNSVVNAVNAHVRKLHSDLLADIDNFLQRSAEDNWQDFTRYALVIGSPPEFSSPDPDDSLRDMYLSELPDFAPLLRRFYADARIDSLWSTCLPSYQAVADSLERLHGRSLNAVWQYSRLPSAARAVPVRVVPNLLNSPHRAMLFYVPSTDTLYVVRGPLSEDDATLDFMVVHEVLHSVVDPVIDECRDSLNATSELRALVAELPTIRDGYEEDYRKIIEESLVRAIELRIAVPYYPGNKELIASALERQYREGFLLIRYFFERLAQDYEMAQGPLTDAIPALITSIDTEAEKQRWTTSQSH